jgi:branched-chain amino acid transport system substrate-binding protein
MNHTYRIVFNEKDGSGRITNKLVGKVFDKYQDVYVNDCKM